MKPKMKTHHLDLGGTQFLIKPFYINFLTENKMTYDEHTKTFPNEIYLGEILYPSIIIDFDISNITEDEIEKM